MKITKILLLPLVSFLIFSSAIAEDNQFGKIITKLDTIEEKQDRMFNKTYNSPLNNKKNGVEVNLARLIMLNSDFTTFSGTYSRFDYRRGVEWAFPVYFGSEDNYEGENTNVATVDVHYRNYLGGAVKGFYISGFSRMTHINGPTGSDFDFSDRNTESRSSSETKLGVGVGIGYRIFSGKDFYWGASLSVGRNLIGENDKFINGFIDDSEYILDVELLKFGYSF